MSLNSINKLIFVMVKCCDIYEVQAKLLNFIYTSFDFKVLL
jgi:hypothetical protein